MKEIVRKETVKTILEIMKEVPGIRIRDGIKIGINQTILDKIRSLKESKLNLQKG